MTARANPLSYLGRMSWTTHTLFYPGAIALYVFGIKPQLALYNERAKQKDWESLPKARKVDPDLFNPFTPIPYHNNPEFPYVFANVKMHNYVNKNHLNVDTYVWKDYHNSYDQTNMNAYMYNWTSVHGPTN